MEFEEEEKKFWVELKNKVEVIPIENAIREISARLDEIGLVEKDGQQVYQGEEAVKLHSALTLYKMLYEENKAFKVWYFKGLSIENLHKMLNIDSAPIPGQSHSTVAGHGKEMLYRGYAIDDMVQMMAMESVKLFELEGKWKDEERNTTPSQENFLIEVGLEKPIATSKNEKYKIFNKILLNLDFNNDEVIKGFSIALSDMDDSMPMFEQIIKEGSDITSLKIRFLNQITNEDD